MAYEAMMTYNTNEERKEKTKENKIIKVMRRGFVKNEVQAFKKGLKDRVLKLRYYHECLNQKLVSCKHLFVFF